jgi:hypothetical protein
MTIHISDFPNVGVVSSRFGLTAMTPASVSPFTGAMQITASSGQIWTGSVTFKPMNQAEASDVQAFIAKLRGRYGTFEYADPDIIARGNRGAGGTVLVNGANQTGKTLAVDGMTPNSTIARKGDYFSFGTGSGKRLHMYTEDLLSDASGEGTATFEPNLRNAPADNTQLEMAAPRGAFRLQNNDDDWSSNQNSIYNISLQFVEAL